MNQGGGQMAERASMASVDMRYTRTGLLDEYIHRDEILDRFGIEKTTFYEKAKRTGLKPIAISTSYYRIDDLRQTILAPIDAFQTHNQDDGNKLKRGRPRKIVDTKRTL
jgi:hypothetical protein